MSVYLAKPIKEFRGGRSIDTIEQGIKFRAWVRAWVRDGEGGKYVYSNSSLARFFKELNGTAVLAIEQWTGYVDSIGEEIYEGDVLTTVGDVQSCYWWDRAWLQSGYGGAVGEFA